MDKGYETHAEPIHSLVVQRHWGAINAAQLSRSVEELLEQIRTIQARRYMILATESEVDFKPVDLINAVETIGAAAPSLTVLAYVLDAERHGTERMILETVAFNLGIRLEVFASEVDARAYLLDE